MLGGEEEKDPDAQKKEEERQEALRQQEEERKAKHARMEAEREKVRQQIRDKVSGWLAGFQPKPWSIQESCVWSSHGFVHVQTCTGKWFNFKAGYLGTWSIPVHWMLVNRGWMTIH